MQALPVPVDEWQQVVFGPSHQIGVVVRVLSGSDPDDVLYDSVPVVGGEVRVDATAQTRRALDVTVVDDDARFGTALQLTPQQGGGVLAPYGPMVQVQYGVVVPGQGLVLLDQGMFRIASAESTGDGTVRVTGYDLSRQVSRAKPVVPLVITAGTKYTDAIVRVVSGGLPALVARRVCVDLAQVVVSTQTTPLIVIDEQADRWAEASKMATAIGYELWFGPNGGLVLRPAVNPARAAPVVRLVEGETALLGVTRSASDDPGYNGVVLHATSSTLPAPIRSVVWDEVRDSPTYHLGPYGEVPLFIDSEYVATQAQADAAAKVELVRQLGSTDRVPVTLLPDPSLEPGDVAVIKRARSGVDGTYVFDELTLPLTAEDAMTGVCRTRPSA